MWKKRINWWWMKRKLTGIGKKGRSGKEEMRRWTAMDCEQDDMWMMREG